jgi:ribose transport system substrate-binding protein
MKLSRFLLFLLAAFLVGMVPACKKDSGKIKIAVVTNNPEDFWKICDAGARKAAKEFDVELIFRMPDKGEVGMQMQIVKSLIEQGVSGVAVSVIDPEEQSPDLKQFAGKTKLVTMDNDAEGSNRICYVGTDNYAAGREVGRLVKETMKDGGDVAIFVGQITPANAQARFQGVVDELAGTGGKHIQGKPAKRTIGDKEIYFTQYGNYFLYKGEAITDGANKEVAQQNAKEALDFLGDRDNVCMIGLWAYNPPKILAALSSKGFTKVKVVGFDEMPETLAAIDQGRMYATVVQDPFNFGYKSVEILAAEARGDQSKRNLPPIPYRVVTKEGGPSKTVDGVEIKNIKATEFRDQLQALIDSVK